MDEKREREEEDPEDLPTFRWIIGGCTGSGKTHLAKWLLRGLPEDGYPSELIVMSSSAKARHWPETTPNRIYTEWDSDTLLRLMKRRGHKLFIIDDFLGLIRPDEPALVHLFVAGRHAGASVMLITQRINGFAPAIRVNASRIFLCRTIAVKELDVLYDEAATAGLRRRQDWYAFVEKETRDRGVLVIEMVHEKDDEPFSTLHPPGELDDLFVEPEYSSDEEDELRGDPTRVRGESTTPSTLKKSLPASNRKWSYKHEPARRKPRKVGQKKARVQSKKR